MSFKVEDTLNSTVMMEFISWIRFVEFAGDSAELYKFKKNAVEEAQQKRWDAGEGFDDPEDAEIYKDSFKAKKIQPFSIENEIKVWLKIEQLVDASL